MIRVFLNGISNEEADEVIFNLINAYRLYKLVQMLVEIDLSTGVKKLTEDEIDAIIYDQIQEDYIETISEEKLEERIKEEDAKNKEKMKRIDEKRKKINLLKRLIEIYDEGKELDETEKELDLEIDKIEEKMKNPPKTDDGPSLEMQELYPIHKKNGSGEDHNDEEEPEDGMGY